MLLLEFLCWFGGLLVSVAVLPASLCFMFVFTVFIVCFFCFVI